MGLPIRTFTVLPHLPERLQSLQKLAYNMWWCWNYEATALFRRIDPDAFEAVDRSPIKLLGAVNQTRLVELLDDDGFLAHMDRVEEAFDNYMSAATWYQETFAPGGRNGAAPHPTLSHPRGEGREGGGRLGTGARLVRFERGPGCSHPREGDQPGRLHSAHGSGRPC